MTSLLSQAQVVAIAPNNYRAFDYSVMSLNSTNLFAFASEHRVLIYDRRDFSHCVIETPDPTKKIVSCAFCGFRFLYCCDSKRMLYKYRRDQNEVYCEIGRFDIGCRPEALRAGSKHCFYISGENLFCLDVHEREFKPYLMSDSHRHKELTVSPCGRAIAAYTQGGAFPVIWFAPYNDRNRFLLPVRGNIVDFKWGLSESLVCVTAGCDRVIRVWVESSDKVEFRCSNWFRCDYQILFLSFCYPCLEGAQPQSFHQAKSANKGVFPYSAVPVYPLLVGVDKENGDGLILEDCSSPKLKKTSVVDLKFNEPVFSCTDTQLTAVKKHVETLMTTTVFAKSALSFHQTEIATEFLRTSVAFKVSFIQKRILRIETNSQGDIITVSDGLVYNWTEGKETTLEPPKLGAYAVEINGKSIKLIAADDVRTFDIGFEPVFSDYVVLDNVLLSFISGSDESVVVMYKGEEFGCYRVSAKELKPVRVAFHSTDFFAVSEPTGVRMFIYTGTEYTEVSRASLNARNPLVLFLPHPMVFLAVASEYTLSFYTVSQRGLHEFNSIPTARIQAMKYIEQTRSLIIATKRTLFKLILPQDFVPCPREMSSDYVVNTALSMCKFHVIDDFLNGRDLTLNSFVERLDAESFVFPSPAKLSGNIKTFCSWLPERWANVDDNGMKFLFSYCLSRVFPSLLEHVSMWSIWALLSRDQMNLAGLLQFTSIHELCDVYAPLWAKNKEVLVAFVSSLVGKSMPKSDEVEDWMLLCVAIGKRQLAGQFAKSNGMEKLASFLFSRETQTKKIESSAYAAQQAHRYSLSAMFFLLRKMHHQALVVLKSRPMLQVLIGRIVEESKWKECIPDEFYSHWWNERTSEAVDVLRRDLPECDIVSLELHRYYLLTQLNAESRLYLLNLQDCPFFVIELLTRSDNDVVQRVVVPEPIPDLEVKEEAKPMEFSFGASDWGVGDSDFDDSEDSDESSESGPKPEQKEASNKVVSQPSRTEKLIFSNLVEALLLSCFDSSAYSVLCRTEESLVELLADVYNDERLSNAIRLLLIICEQMLNGPNPNIPMVIALLFAIAYGESHFTIMSPLLEEKCDLHNCLVALDLCKVQEKMGGDRHQQCIKYLTKLFSAGDSISDSDIQLVKYSAFHQMAQALSSKLTDKHISIVTSFLHHRHRVMFDRLPSCSFSSGSMCSELKFSGIGSKETITMMAQAKQDEKWVLAVHDPYISPFFIDTGFVSSFSYNFQFPATHATGICINGHNNQSIALAGNRVIKTMISQEQLDGSYGDGTNVKTVDEWDVVLIDEEVSIAEQTACFQSPFVPVMPSSKTIPKKPKTRSLSKMANWRSDSLSEKDVKAKCIDAHPTAELFATGDNVGRIHIWNFDMSRSTAVAAHRIYDKRIDTVEFNVAGDRILCLASDGEVIISDFVAEHRFRIATNSRIRWLNSDTQFVVSEPMNSRFAVYDILCDTSRPVATLDYSQDPQAYCPFDICNSHIAAGFTDGSAIVLDTRIARRIGHLDLHEENISCVTYDPSGSFFMTGSSDNAVAVVEAKTLSKVEQLRNVLPEYDPTKTKRGIVSLAISKQSIVAAGYSPCLHIWTSTGAQLK